jgi:hypothetical protein
MQRHDVRALVITGALAAVVIGAVSLGGSGHHSATAAAPAGSNAAGTRPAATNSPNTAAGDPAASGPVDSASAAGTDSNGDAVGSEDGCVMTQRSVQLGDTGPSVECLHRAMISRGLYSGAATNAFDAATEKAIRQLQTDKNFFVDGKVGRETAIELGIWPNEASMVVHTPPPAPGAVDLMGYKLSSVASTGAGAPPLPPNSGTGRRLVYSRIAQRVWAIDDQGRIVRSWLVSGSKFNNEVPGTHAVYSRSDVTTAWNGKAYLHLMVRWLKTQRGNIGFHSIPIHVADGTAYMTEAELGQRLSGGCQRQAPLDAAFTWAFAQIGTKVVVL